MSYMPVQDAFNSGLGVNQLIQLSNADEIFDMLGSFTLDSNEHSGYQSRELKTIHLNVNCQFFRLVIHRGHENRHNIFNQVGIIKLQFLGKTLGEYELDTL